MKNRNCTIFALALLALELTAIRGLAQSTYEPYTFTTLAGSASQGSADGTGSAAQFSFPQGVAVDTAGNIFVADSGNATIRKLTPAGVVATVAGSVGNYGSDDGTNDVARFGGYRTSFPVGPTGVAVDNAGNVYVADTSNSTIRKMTPAGVVTTLAGMVRCFADQSGGWRWEVGSADGTGGAAQFNFPQGVAVDNNGNVYVADYWNYTIRKVTPAGLVTTLAGLAGTYGNADGTGSDARFGGILDIRPIGLTGVAVDRGGNVYVADPANSSIRKVTPTGAVTTLAGALGFVTGLAVDRAGNVYVADPGNFTILKVTSTGVVTTLAGGGHGSADGTGGAVQFGGTLFRNGGNPCVGVAVDADGNVYVADTLNHTIRKGYPTLATISLGPSFRFSRGQFGFDLTGPAGQAVVVETSTDLVSWLPIWTNTFAGALHFTDPQLGVASNRFYRASTP